MTDEQAYLCKSDLKARGWTESLINKHLEPQDKTRTNPRYSSSAPMLLWLLERVERAEASEEFKAAQEGRASRRAAAQRAVETKRARVRTWLDALKVSVPKMGMKKLVLRACDSYNAMRSARFLVSGYLSDPADENSDQDFLDRICVNYLRHELTCYERHLGEIAGKVGATDSYLELKDKVLDAIAEAYSELGVECLKQSQAAAQAEFAREMGFGK